MTSDSHIAAARKLGTNVPDRDTDEELPVSRDTWPGELDMDLHPTNDTIPTPPPSSGSDAVEHLTIPAMPPLPSDTEN
jgi:hypothetical protein